NGAQLDEAARDLGPAAIAIYADVCSAVDVRGAVSRAVEEMSGLDTLVACAGVIHVKPLLEVTEENWDRTLDINPKGMFLRCQAAAPALIASGRGRIVPISSDAGRRGVPHLLRSPGSTFGLIGLTEA